MKRGKKRQRTLRQSLSKVRHVLHPCVKSAWIDFFASVPGIDNIPNEVRFLLQEIKDKDVRSDGTYFSISLINHVKEFDDLTPQRN